MARCRVLRGVSTPPAADVCTMYFMPGGNFKTTNVTNIEKNSNFCCYNASFPQGSVRLIMRRDMGRFFDFVDCRGRAFGNERHGAVHGGERYENQARGVKFEDYGEGHRCQHRVLNAARARAERQRIRKEHNEIEIRIGLNGAMTSYNDPWTKSRGGDNNFTISSWLNMKYVYNNDPFRLYHDGECQSGI